MEILKEMVKRRERRTKPDETFVKIGKGDVKECEMKEKPFETRVKPFETEVKPYESMKKKYF
jgi:hypothetical protein